jgi:hypothetical protein
MVYKCNLSFIIKSEKHVCISIVTEDLVMETDGYFFGSLDTVDESFMIIRDIVEEVHLSRRLCYDVVCRINGVLDIFVWLDGW